MVSSLQESTSLDIQALARYRKDGFLVLTELFSLEETTQLSREVGEIETKMTAIADSGIEYFLDGRRFVDVGVHTLQFEAPPNDERLRVLEPAYGLSPLFQNLLSDPRLTEPMMQILGVDGLSLWTDKINFKCAGGTGFGWHQDAPYWMHDTKNLTELPNVMIALEEVTSHSGAFEVIRGSHVQGIRKSKDDGSQLEGFYTHADEVELMNREEFIVPAGSAIFFDPFLIHGSGPNESSRSRRAIIATYQPVDRLTLKSKTIVNLTE